VEERAMWSGGKMQVLYSLLQCIYVALLLSLAVHTDVWLGKILMAVVDATGEVSEQLFASYMPRYKYVLLFPKQHKNGMSLFLIQFCSGQHSEMSAWSTTCTH
jgi:hypothetical protein